MYKDNDKPTLKCLNYDSVSKIAVLNVENRLSEDDYVILYHVDIYFIWQNLICLLQRKYVFFCIC